MMSDYFNKLNSAFINTKNNLDVSSVPIIKDDSLLIILFLIKSMKLKRVLEIGTAVGYSAISMVKGTDVFVDTIEKDEKMYKKALENIKNERLEDRICVFNADAIEFDMSLLKDKYDLIFIDAAKAQYQKFFEKYSLLLSDNGVIVTDNLLFHGYVEEYVQVGEVSGSKNLKGLAWKIDRYNKWLSENEKFDTIFLELGDGIALSIRK